MKQKDSKGQRKASLKYLDEPPEGSSRDITHLAHELGVHQEELKAQNEELRQAQLELSHAHDRYKELFDSAPIGYLILDGNQTIREANLKAAALLGMIRKDLIGSPVSKFMAQEEANAYYLHLMDVRKSGTQQSRELQFRWPDGSLFHVHLETSPHEDNIFGKGWRIALVDITERKWAEESMRQAHERSEWLARFPEENPGPVLRASSEGKALYCNPAAAELEGWECRVDRKLSEPLLTLVKQAMTEGRVVKEDVDLGEKAYAIVVIPIPEGGYANVYGRDISERKRAETALRESEVRIRRKLDSVLMPEGDFGDLELADIIDVPAIQSLMDDFYRLSRIPMSIIDLKGTLLVGVGWQEICKTFHRAHPDTCRHCVESDSQLSAGILPGESRLYKCKNNMWDIATPVIVGGQHMGHVFSGQFFFDDEPLDYDLFRSQARQYGFDEKEYMAALDNVPRLSRESVDTGMAFLLKLADMLSKLSYGNLKLARSLTERDALTESLRQSREDLDHAQVVGQIGSWRLDVRRNVLTWSDENHRIFGVPKGTPMSYETFLGVVHPDDRQYVDTQWTAGLRGEPYDIEHRIVVDGQVKWVREKAYLEFADSGALLGGFGITQDITERKRAEEALQSTLQRFYTVLSSMHSSILLVKDEGRVEFANQAFCDYVGLKDSPADLKELTSNEVIEKIKNVFLNPDEAVTRIKEIVGRGQPVIGEEVVSRDGRTYLRDYIPLSVDGKSYGRLWHHWDITEIKRSQDALREAKDELEQRVKERTYELYEESLYARSLIEASLDPLVTISVDGKITDVNHSSEEVTGISREQLIGSDFSDYFTEPEKARAGYEQVFSQGFVRDYPLELKHRDGHVTPVLYNASVYRDDTGHTLGVFAAARDITELKRAEAALRKLASELVMAEERERKRIAGVLHDEVAQTLAAAKMRIDMLQRIPFDQEDKQTLKDARGLLLQSIQETRALMNDLGNPLLFDMGLKPACEALAERLMERHPVRIRCDIRDAYKHLDPDAKTILYQVTRELLNNVVKHSQAGNAHVLIEEDNGQFRVKVKDDGVGFDARTLGAPTSEGGFGLYSIRERLMAMDGSLNIESAPGTGTTVTAILPKAWD